MTRALVVVLMVLPSSTGLLAAPEFMLCFHRDGQVRIEPFVPSCCQDESSTACPDEDCADLPVVESAPETNLDPTPIPSESPAFEAVVTPEFVPHPPVRNVRRPRSFSGPPPPGPEQHLSTVVLRI